MAHTVVSSAGSLLVSKRSPVGVWYASCRLADQVLEADVDWIDAGRTRSRIGKPLQKHCRFGPSRPPGRCSLALTRSRHRARNNHVSNQTSGRRWLALWAGTCADTAASIKAETSFGLKAAKRPSSETASYPSSPPRPCVAEEILAAGRAPLHGAADPQRSERNNDLFRIDRCLASEGLLTSGGNYMDRTSRSKGIRQLIPGPCGGLGRYPCGQTSSRRLPSPSHAAPRPSVAAGSVPLFMKEGVGSSETPLRNRRRARPVEQHFSTRGLCRSCSRMRPVERHRWPASRRLRDTAASGRPTAWV